MANTCTCSAEQVGAPYHADWRSNTTQVGGSHYQRAIQPWDYIVANDIPYLEGNVIKYVTRWRDKGGIEDLHKAQHYLAKIIEVESVRLASFAPSDQGAVR